MRPLTIAECEFVSGAEEATAVADIFVNYPGGGGGWTWGGGGWFGSSSGWGSEVPPPPPPPPPPPQQVLSPCELDIQEDAAARLIENLIRSKADWNEREYGALILRDSLGYLYVGELQAGETVAEAEARALAAGETDYEPRTNLGGVPEGFTVVGAVHSHPSDGYNAAQSLQNQYPSDRPNDGDYSLFEGLVGIDPRFSSAADFSQYIFGPDGNLREFNFIDGRVTAANDTRAESRTNLASDRVCSGG